MFHFFGCDSFLVDNLSKCDQLLPYVGVFLLKQFLMRSYVLPFGMPSIHLYLYHLSSVYVTFLAVSCRPHHKLGFDHL
jgi:hypothetical protein